MVHGRRLATGCFDKSIHIWDTISGERLRMWRTESSVSLGFSHQGNVLASSGWDAYTRLWDFSGGQQVSSFPTAGHFLGFAPNDLRMATGGWDGIMLEFFEVALGRGLRALYEAPEVSGGWPIMDLKGRFLAFRTQAGMELWDVQTVQQISALGLDKRMSPVGFDPDDQNLILTGSQGLFRCPIAKSGGGDVRNIGKPILVSTECADPAGGRMGRISANGKICAIVGNDRCQIFRTDTFEKQAETDKLLGMRYSDINWDGSLFASGARHYGGVRVWDAQTGGLVAKLLTEDEHKDLSAAVSFSPDGRRLVTATMYEYIFWEVGSWSLAQRIPQPEGNDFSPMMSFTPDGRILAGTHSRNKVRLHDAATGQVLADLEAPNSRMITGLAFNRDGTRLFASESADALRVWDLRQIREKLAELGLGWDQPPYPVAEPGPGTQAKRSADRTNLPVAAGQR